MKRKIEKKMKSSFTLAEQATGVELAQCLGRQSPVRGEHFYS